MCYFLFGKRQVFLNDCKHLQFPCRLLLPSISAQQRLHVFIYTCVFFAPITAHTAQRRVPGTHHVWHSSRLFCFGRLPAPVLHLFAGPVWCGVNNIQTYTHALISIHSVRQGRTPFLLRGWHFGKGQIHLAKNLIMFGAFPSCSPKNRAFVSSQKHLFFVQADCHVFINLCHIKRGNTCGLEWHRNTRQ